MEVGAGRSSARSERFRREEHGFFLFDNFNSMDFALVTVHCSKATTPFTPLGFSKPDLYRVPIVVTVDESAIWDSTEPWLSQNLAEILLAGPCYCQLRKQSICPDTSGPPAPKNHSRDMGLTAIVDTAFGSPPMTPSSFGK